MVNVQAELLSEQPSRERFAGCGAITGGQQVPD
jgi:hypothetical protein